MSHGIAVGRVAGDMSLVTVLMVQWQPMYLIHGIAVVAAEGVDNLLIELYVHVLAWVCAHQLNQVINCMLDLDIPAQAPLCFSTLLRAASITV